jgi:hypothetical protein
VHYAKDLESDDSEEKKESDGSEQVEERDDIEE